MKLEGLKTNEKRVNTLLIVHKIIKFIGVDYMNNYQKAIKVRKVCETQAYCNINGWNCPYKDYCLKSNIVFINPTFQDLKVVAKAIKEEKWKVD